MAFERMDPRAVAWRLFLPDRTVARGGTLRPELQQRINDLLGTPQCFNPYGNAALEEALAAIEDGYHMAEKFKQSLSWRPVEVKPDGRVIGNLDYLKGG